MTARKELVKIFEQRGAHSLDFPDGWIPLLDSLNVDLSAVDPDYTVSTVKVKFGGLRVYYRSSRPGDPVAEPLMRDLVQRAERAAAGTCEICSGAGVERTGYWVLCDEHSDGREPIGDDED